MLHLCVTHVLSMPNTCRTRNSIIELLFTQAKPQSHYITLYNFAWARSKEKVYFKFHKVHSQPAISFIDHKEYFIAPQRVLYSFDKALFVGNKAQLPTWLSVGVIPYQINQKKSRPLRIFMKFGIDIGSTKKLSHTKIWPILLISL